MQGEQQKNDGRESSRKTIMLIEDQSVFSKIIKMTIEFSTSYRVIHFNDGTTILDLLNEHQPQLLLVDYELPGKNGIEICDLVHATPGWERFPIIMMSAELPRQELAARGIPGLPKPCRTSDLVEAIEALIA